MSEPTAAQEAYAADMALDARIDAYYDEHHKPVNQPDPLDAAPDPEPPPQYLWYEDIDECVAFARWYWQGTFNYIGSAREILDFFEKPWKFEEEYGWYKADKLCNP